MKYNKDETLDHEVALEYPECVKILDELVEDEGYSGPLPFFGVNVEVIDMDCVEGKIASKEKRVPNKSMDCAFVVSDIDGDKKILFVELRFNYSNLSNLSRNYLIGKTEGSLNAIGNSLTVLNDYAFVFESSIFEQARSRFSRMDPRVPSNFNVYDLKRLKDKYF